MTALRRSTVGAAVLLALLPACLGGRHGTTTTTTALAPTTAVAGTWVGATSVGSTSQAGHQTFTLVLSQAGDSLSGRMTIDSVDARPLTEEVTGSVTGHRVTWTTGERGFTFQGTVTADRMAGMWGSAFTVASPIALSRQRPPDDVSPGR